MTTTDHLLGWISFDSQPRFHDQDPVERPMPIRPQAEQMSSEELRSVDCPDCPESKSRQSPAGLAESRAETVVEEIIEEAEDRSER